jgi:NADH-quinone oxidoreductase subunit M
MNAPPILSLLVLLPLMGAVACGFANNRLTGRIVHLVLGFECLLSVLALILFDQGEAGFQLVENHPWITSLNIRILLGVDGISILFLPMTALMFTFVYRLTCQSTPGRLYASLLLTLMAATMGIFTALDSILFFLFWELTLPPLFFLVSRFGSAGERLVAATKYTLYMLMGGALILFAFIYTALEYARVSGAGLSFNIPDLMQVAMPIGSQRIVFVLLVLGFATKIPLAPLHTWLPKTASEAPAQVTALLLGLKLGVYGLLRFLFPLVPAALVEYRQVLAMAGAASLLYGAVVALKQSNLRLLLAYAGLSHVGLVVMGIASLDSAGLQGAIMQLFNFTLIAFALMLLANMLHARTGSTELLNLGGLASSMPLLSTFMIWFMLGSVAAPLTAGFPAELLLLIGNFRTHPGLGITAIAGAILVAAAMLNWVRKALWGEPVTGEACRAGDLLPAERRVLLVLGLMVLVFGLLPSLLLGYINPAILLDML